MISGGMRVESWEPRNDQRCVAPERVKLRPWVLSRKGRHGEEDDRAR